MKDMSMVKIGVGKLACERVKHHLLNNNLFV